MNYGAPVKAACANSEWRSQDPEEGQCLPKVQDKAVRFSTECFLAEYL